MCAVRRGSGGRQGAQTGRKGAGNVERRQSIRKVQSLGSSAGSWWQGGWCRVGARATRLIRGRCGTGAGDSWVVLWTVADTCQGGDRVCALQRWTGSWRSSTLGAGVRAFLALQCKGRGRPLVRIAGAVSSVAVRTCTVSSVADWRCLRRRCLCGQLDTRSSVLVEQEGTQVCYVLIRGCSTLVVSCVACARFPGGPLCTGTTA